MKLAADANVLLSAVLGGRAKLIFRHSKITEILTTQSNLVEVEQYALILAKKKQVSSDLVLLALAAMPVSVVERREYAKRLPQALRRIGDRDPDDADLLALALHFRIPIWSNDRDFEGLNIELFTTERLLRHVGLIR